MEEKEKHLALSDFEFEKQFFTGELDPKIFSHEAHLRLAWIHINKYGIGLAEKNIQTQLQNFVKLVGAEHKYNTTLTVAAVKAVDHFIRKSEATNFEELILEFPQLKFHFKELMACHYGFDIYHSEQAKAKYLEPDLLPFNYN